MTHARIPPPTMAFVDRDGRLTVEAYRFLSLLSQDTSDLEASKIVDLSREEAAQDTAIIAGTATHGAIYAMAEELFKRLANVEAMIPPPMQDMGLTGFASRSDQLAGTNQTRASTPYSVAALWERGTDVNSAGTLTLGEGGYFRVEGTTTITDIDFGVDKSGRRVWLVFADSLTLTHNGTSLILPTAANIQTASGDCCLVVSEDGSNNVRVLSYMRADGSPVTAVVSSGTYTPTLTNVANVAASTAYQCQYMRVGATVTVSGRVDIDVTAGATLTTLSLDLPVSTTFGATEDAGGVAFCPAVASLGGAIFANTSAATVRIEFISSADTANRAFFFVFAYQVI